MTAFALTGRFVGDFVPLLVPIDTEDTMEKFASVVASFAVGIRVPRPDPLPGYEVLLDGEVIPAEKTLDALMGEQTIYPLQWFDVRFREA
ncbi:toluene-4-monooxygenase system B family protein [Nocardioides sp. WS12]|uniref:toluene-4-monooxygenase system B family protein n=1 Tax=Nocardioides sp. WS12 TaxID=2486272 RepID=UPI0015F9571B|nr:toluene-4-monooxygenase system B family protein [Nocardioides sp. WS12]